ncbi:hypothetical protein SADUNF_Sadunf16G0136800 [Salix dunnii]|uniref:DNA-directed RNA polymerase RBP11-like dimerisation domain-containing protein n=1 Tax=Salix dunnii TaxID=1413687 RepID=A0A835MGX6_9ROSI|nr:hypothetical protein SADUNF_Sadunf16G0136800 [Salix dunnii]
MEHGSVRDPSSATFCFVDEDHTLANSVRFALNQEYLLYSTVLLIFNIYIPRVSFCGYSIPHPSDAKVNIRVQTTGDPAREVLKDACQNLMMMCQHVRSTLDKAVDDYRRNPTDMDTK